MIWRNPLSNKHLISKGRDYHLSKSLRQTTSRIGVQGKRTTIKIKGLQLKCPIVFIL
jgi:hypothetical protein